MHQLTQQLKSGKMEILEVPFPVLGKGELLVRNYYSVISAGTEGKTVSDARKGYIAKAKSRQKEVKQVIEMIKTQGLQETYKMVMNKLEAPAPLGYSCAGEVIAVGESISGFKVGDKVACGGASASHAEVIAVPVNLCVKIPEEVNLKYAAFATIASIAIQGIRQAELTMGERCVIIGLGLIGQITALVLQSSGIEAIGVDISKKQTEIAIKNGVKIVYERNIPGIEELIRQQTAGIGADAIIITAASSSLDPVEFAGNIVRKKGKVVIVGAVPTGFSRENYYKKELDLRMSCSYGPGRYDTTYEEKGIDYPPGYVRFTENRNMESFIHLLKSGTLDISTLITHEFELPGAPDAYSMILAKSEPFTGIVIRYNSKEELQHEVILQEKSYPKEDVNAGFIGAGSFAQNILLPNLKDFCNFKTICTIRGNESIYVGKKYNFSYATDTPGKVINDPDCNTIFIVTRHNSHAAFVLETLKAGKHVFVEKPLALYEEDLKKIDHYYRKEGKSMLMVGYNRRFSQAVQKIKATFDGNIPKSINMRINAGYLPPDHWVNDPETGGGRIIGEACHFIDLAMFLAGSLISSVYATSMDDSTKLSNTTTINLTFKNGSIASIAYFSNGNKKVSKEYIEVFCGNSVAIINDFKFLTLIDNSVKKIRFKNQDKGHAEELKQFTAAIKNGKPCPIPYEEIFHISQVTFDTIKSIKEKHPFFYKS